MLSTVLALLPWAVALFFLIGAVGMSMRLTRAETAQVEAEDRAVAMRSAAIASVVPLSWLWQMVEAPEAVDDARARIYLAQAFEAIREAIAADEATMADLVEEALDRAQPRRLPRYPQIPSYIASPEDALAMPREVIDLRGARTDDL